MAATVSVRFTVHKGVAGQPGDNDARGFPTQATSCLRNSQCRENFIATVGYPIREDGAQEDEDVTLASKRALLNMIDLLGERGYTPEQAYVICSVAVDLRISNIVDLPNVTVSAFLPEGIFV